MKWTLLALIVLVGCQEKTRKGSGTEACLACGEFVSQKAVECPQCGEPYPTNTGRVERRDELKQKLKRIKVFLPTSSIDDKYDLESRQSEIYKELNRLPISD